MRAYVGVGSLAVRAYVGVGWAWARAACDVPAMGANGLSSRRAWAARSSMRESSVRSYLQVHVWANVRWMIRLHPASHPEAGWVQSGSLAHALSSCLIRQPVADEVKGWIDSPPHSRVVTSCPAYAVRARNYPRGYLHSLSYDLR